MKTFSRYVTVVAAVLSALLLASCAEDQLYFGADRPLAFSTDTLGFDTVFTERGTATRSFKIYNPYKNPMLIRRITHENPVFRLNVDGRSCDSISDVRIEARDSLRVLVQACIDPTDDRRPVRETDHVSFYCNGLKQQVVLEAFGRNVKRMRGVVLQHDTALTSDWPILVQDSLVVAAGARLSIKPGTVLYFEKTALLQVYGTLSVEGTVANPVLMRGDRSDYMNTVPPLSYDQASAQWLGVRFKSGSVGNAVDGLVMRNSSWGIEVENSQTTELSLTILNSQLSNSSGDLLRVSGAKVLLANSLLSNAGGYVLNMSGGSCQAFFCTFANYYGFAWGGREGAIVRQANYDLDAQGKVVEQALDLRVCNSIVYGSWTMEISRESLGGAALDYEYVNCLVRVKASAIDDHYRDCVYNASPEFEFMFWPEGERPFDYDFHLKSSSAAIDNAKKTYAYDYPFDLDGRSRTSDGAPDIGCYEYAD